MNLRTFNPMSLIRAAATRFKAHFAPKVTGDPSKVRAALDRSTFRLPAPSAPAPDFYGYKPTPQARNQRRRDRASVRAFVAALNRARG